MIAELRPTDRWERHHTNSWLEHLSETMKTDIFISYAWTSPEHKSWVRLLASQLRHIGYTVKIDYNQKYGTDMKGFMRNVVDSARVLLVVDENYVDRANTLPNSGVGIETAWIREVHAQKPAGWMSVLFVGNPEWRLPAWLGDTKPKGFNFNADSEAGVFPGEQQIDELWRWISDLPADTAHAISPKVLLERMARLEQIAVRRDPSNFANPDLSGRVDFKFKDHPEYTVGHSEYQFKIKFSSRSQDSVYVLLNGGLNALGIVNSAAYDPETVGDFLRTGDHAEPTVGQKVVLQNAAGALCVIVIEAVQREVNAEYHVPASVTFSFEILVGQ